MRIREHERVLSSNRDEMGDATSLGDASLEPKKKKQKLAIGVGPPDLPSPKKKVVTYAFTARTDVSFLPEETVGQGDVDRISDLG